MVDGELGFKEFVRMLAYARTTIATQIQRQLGELREMFSLFDPNGDGAITGCLICVATLLSVLGRRRGGDGAP